MTLTERFGTRDRAFSRWTRTLIDPETDLPDRRFDWIDLDCVPYCTHCRTVKALFELARDNGQNNKATTVLRNLARSAGLKAYLVYYTPAEDDSTILAVRIRQVEPWRDEEFVRSSVAFAMWWAHLPCLNENCKGPIM